MTLQWATYRDASDQTSLSRIWGGIHPPVDDIPGRRIGYRVGHDAFAKADAMFSGTVTSVTDAAESKATVSVAAWPNPVRRGQILQVGLGSTVSGEVALYNVLGQRLLQRPIRGTASLTFDTGDLASGLYLLRVTTPGGVLTPRILVVE